MAKAERFGAAAISALQLLRREEHDLTLERVARSYSPDQWAGCKEIFWYFLSVKIFVLTSSYYRLRKNIITGCFEPPALLFLKSQYAPIQTIRALTHTDTFTPTHLLDCPHLLSPKKHLLGRWKQQVFCVLDRPVDDL